MDIKKLISVHLAELELESAQVGESSTEMTYLSGQQDILQTLLEEIEEAEREADSKFALDVETEVRMDAAGCLTGGCE